MVLKLHQTNNRLNTISKTSATHSVSGRHQNMESVDKVNCFKSEDAKNHLIVSDTKLPSAMCVRIMFLYICMCVCACICIPLSLSLTTIMGLNVSTSGYVLRITMHAVAVFRPAPSPNWEGNSCGVDDHTKSP